MRPFIILLLLIPTFFLLGCQTVKYQNEASGRFEPGHDSEGTKPGLRVTDSNFPGTRARLNSVGITTDSLRYKIAIEATNSKRTPTQTLEVWTQIRNRTDYPLQVECRVQWFDGKQAPVDKPTAWQRIHLPPNSLETYREFSTNIYDINFYYIEIREGR